ncbi:hypothetical protein J3Q64DRAFT_1767276 [Phycomyces blakesleeanus]|uniref:Uncharacterized protein n=1 Tax=Phycomyces blakesleeanus TaxID=4837 RepID=A0ABR3AMH1_PHYBL
MYTSFFYKLFKHIVYVLVECRLIISPLFGLRKKRDEKRYSSPKQEFFFKACQSSYGVFEHKRRIFEIFSIIVIFIIVIYTCLLYSANINPKLIETTCSPIQKKRTT